MNIKKIERIRMNSKKSINSFEMKKDGLPDYLLNNFYFYQLINNFSALLLFKINVIDIFYMGDFVSDFCYIAK